MKENPYDAALETATGHLKGTILHNKAIVLMKLGNEQEAMSIAEEAKRWGKPVDLEHGMVEDNRVLR